MDEPLRLLRDRLHDAGLRDVMTVTPAPGGQAATAGIAHRTDGSTLFVKTLDGLRSAPDDLDADGAFVAEAEGLAALADAGMPTPGVVVVRPDLLALAPLEPRPAEPAFWTDLAHRLAHLHTTTRHDRFGWHGDNWLGRRRQVNTWTDDGFEFFAQHRLLRWLAEPRVSAALDTTDRAALEHLCERLPELLPEQPACLVHGDLWAGNVLATAGGTPALIDPAVSYTWAEIDLAHLWTTAPPPESAPFFDLYADLTGLDDGWRERMPIIQLRQHLAVVAQFEPDWGAAEIAGATLAPFRRRPR